jgi:hypothetical protein
VILTAADPACLLQVGTTTVDTVLKNGRVVVEGGRVLPRVQSSTS